MNIIGMSNLDSGNATKSSAHEAGYGYEDSCVQSTIGEIVMSAKPVHKQRVWALRIW